MSAVDLLTVAAALDRWAEVVRADRPIDASIMGLRQMARVVRVAAEPAIREDMIAAAALARHSPACDGGHSLVGIAAAEAAVDAIIALGRRAPVSADAVPVKPGEGWQNGQAAKAMLFHYAQEVRPHAEALGLCREAVREAALASAGKVFDEAWPPGSQIGGA